MWNKDPKVGKFVRVYCISKDNDEARQRKLQRRCVGYLFRKWPICTAVTINSWLQRNCPAEKGYIPGGVDRGEGPADHRFDTQADQGRLSGWRVSVPGEDCNLAEIKCSQRACIKEESYLKAGMGGPEQRDLTTSRVESVTYSRRRDRLSENNTDMMQD